MLGERIHENGRKRRHGSAATCWPAIRRPRNSSPPSWPSVSFRTILLRLWWNANGGDVSQDRRRSCARCYRTHAALAGVLGRPSAYRAKVKTPLEFVASALRASGADIENPMPLVRELNTMGMPLYGAQPPTGYSMQAESWVNSAALLSRMNFALALASGRMPGVQLDRRKCWVRLRRSQRGTGWRARSIVCLPEMFRSRPTTPSKSNCKTQNNSAAGWMIRNARRMWE